LYTKIESDVNFSGPLLKSASAELEEWYVTPRFIYTAVKTDRYSMDLIAGGRIFRAETEINVRGRNGGSASANDSTAWVDPIIGIRGRGELGHDFFFNYYGDIGGFGVSSRLTWQALAGLGYNLSKTCSVGIGYRALGMDYDEDGLKIDLISHGPYLGFEFSF
jgi:opacity protein-like surface antigen